MTAFTCPNCNGTGSIGSRGDGIHGHTMRCENCKGKGIITPGKPWFEPADIWVMITGLSLGSLFCTFFPTALPFNSLSWWGVVGTSIILTGVVFHHGKR